MVSTPIDHDSHDSWYTSSTDSEDEYDKLTDLDLSESTSTAKLDVLLDPPDYFKNDTDENTALASNYEQASCQGMRNFQYESTEKALREKKISTDGNTVNNDSREENVECFFELGVNSKGFKENGSDNDEIDVLLGNQRQEEVFQSVDFDKDDNVSAVTMTQRSSETDGSYASCDVSVDSYDSAVHIGQCNYQEEKFEGNILERCESRRDGCLDGEANDQTDDEQKNAGEDRQVEREGIHVVCHRERAVIFLPSDNEQTESSDEIYEDSLEGDSIINVSRYNFDDLDNNELAGSLDVETIQEFSLEDRIMGSEDGIQDPLDVYQEEHNSETILADSSCQKRANKDSNDENVHIIDVEDDMRRRTAINPPMQSNFAEGLVIAQEDPAVFGQSDVDIQMVESNLTSNTCDCILNVDRRCNLVSQHSIGVCCEDVLYYEDSVIGCEECFKYKEVQELQEKDVFNDHIQYCCNRIIQKDLNGCYYCCLNSQSSLFLGNTDAHASFANRSCCGVPACCQMYRGRNICSGEYCDTVGGVAVDGNSTCCTTCCQMYRGRNICSGEYCDIVGGVAVNGNSACCTSCCI